MSIDEMKEEYDDNHNLIYRRTALGVEYWYNYDDEGNCLYKEDSRGNKNWFEYDENGREIRNLSSEGREIRQKYDVHGNVTSVEFIGDFDEMHKVRLLRRLK